MGGVKIEWKTNWPVPKWLYAYFVSAYFLLGACFQWRGHPYMWVTLGIQIAFLFLFSHFMRRIRRSASIGFDGERLEFGKDYRRSSWRLSDIDSVLIRDRLIQIRLYRPGHMGNEFTARAEHLTEESWAALTELCRNIQARLQASESPASANLGAG